MNIAWKQIAAGTTIMPQIGAVLYDEHLFLDPDTFKPERFIDKVKNTHAPSKYLKPFDVGKRACLGKSLVRMELSIVFASVIKISISRLQIPLICRVWLAWLEWPASQIILNAGLVRDEPFGGAKYYYVDNNIDVLAKTSNQKLKPLVIILQA
uniref:Cytochrome P450 n=1 Tax=Ditylenchus dipsaci TaxID=166011 RepID=A0A915CNI3_9BILA